MEKLAQNIEKFHGEKALNDAGKVKLNDAYDRLNATGQNKAVEQVEMLTKIPEYQKSVDQLPEDTPDQK